MRRTLSCLSALVLSVSTAHALPCQTPRDQTAFEVTGLRNELMVLALTCSASEHYNTFMEKFHSNLAAENASVQTYFTHAYGAHGGAAYDHYITDLSNTTAKTSLADGEEFCDRHAELFGKVEALKTPTDMVHFAHEEHVAQPVHLALCGAPRTATKGRHH